MKDDRLLKSVDIFSMSNHDHNCFPIQSLSPIQVWDLFLYEILVNNDPGAAEQYYVAVKCNDEATKQQYQDQYFQYTLDSMKQHVYSILSDVDTLTAKAQNYDLSTHPRVPVIVAHNNLVRDTFTMTAALLEQMG